MAAKFAGGLIGRIFGRKRRRKPPPTPAIQPPRPHPPPPGPPHVRPQPPPFRVVHNVSRYLLLDSKQFLQSDTVRSCWSFDALLHGERQRLMHHDLDEFFSPY